MTSVEFWLIKVKEDEAARNWLKGIQPMITHGAHKPDGFRIQIAFTWKGLLALGLDKKMEGFRPEFVQGIDTGYRQRLLGDLGESEPKYWNWGGPSTEEVHLVLMVYAENETILEELHQKPELQWEGKGVDVFKILDSWYSPHAKEHFGFRDGLSQPIVQGLSRKGTQGNPEVPAGEFVIGYKNAYQGFPESPFLPAEQDPDGLLPDSEQRPGMRDLGKNGTYMVFRQLDQNVRAFWDFVLGTVQKENPEAGIEEAIQLASKMVGRWPSGCPVTLSPDKDDTSLEKENDFLFNPDDVEGFRCPVGSHIRRSNPRDSLLRKKPEYAMKISQRHRILRRGRLYGTPMAPKLDPEQLIPAKDDKVPRGLHFICFNTNIARQFEFVQHTWNDNTKFQGMYDDPDPILGIKDSRNKNETHDFTIPAKPLRRKVRGLQRYVHVVGGAYFFMPGIRALNYILNMEKGY